MSKFYFHFRSIQGIVFFSLCSIVFAYTIVRSGFLWFSIALLIGSVLFVLMGLYLTWEHRNKKEFKVKTKHDVLIKFAENEILFPEGYFFKVSSLNKSRRISVNEITEINIHTFPPSFVRNHNEVIFIRCDLKGELKSFGESNNIPIVERYDIWEELNAPFLDTEFDEVEKLKMIERLEKNGISHQETLEIRKKIKGTMLSSNFFAWEWAYLGLYDYLMWTTILTEKKYWWAMEIALRNYKKSNA